MEITSIADNDKHFKINGNEERFNKWRGEELIPLHELQKLEELFPNQVVATDMEKAEKDGAIPSDLISNPFYGVRNDCILERHAESFSESAGSSYRGN